MFLFPNSFPGQWLGLWGGTIFDVPRYIFTCLPFGYRAALPLKRLHHQKLVRTLLYLALLAVAHRSVARLDIAPSLLRVRFCLAIITSTRGVPSSPRSSMMSWPFGLFLHDPSDFKGEDALPHLAMVASLGHASHSAHPPRSQSGSWSKLVSRKLTSLHLTFPGFHALKGTSSPSIPCTYL